MEKFKLEAICDEIKPGFPSGNHNSKGEGVLHFRPYNIDSSGRVDLSQSKFVSLKNEQYFLREGDIVFNNTNSPELLGKTCYIQKPDNWVYSNHMTRIRVKDNVHPRYCAIYLHYLFYSGFYRANCSNHVNQASISSSFLSKFVEVPLPSYKEQEQIVSKIEELFSELDKGIEELKTAQQQLKVYRQAVLKWAFEGKLSSSKAEWGKVRLGEVAFAVDPQPSHRTPPKVVDGVPYVSTKDFDYEQDKINFSNARIVSSTVLEEHLERYKLEKGDFVIGKIGTIGKPVRVVLPQDYTLSANIVLVQPRQVDKTYLYYFFQSNFIEREFQSGAKATTQAAFGIQKVRELIIHLPTDEEQHQIVQEIESRFTVCDKVEETINDSLRQAEALRQSILKEAFERNILDMK